MPDTDSYEPTDSTRRSDPLVPLSVWDRVRVVALVAMQAVLIGFAAYGVACLVERLRH